MVGAARSGSTLVSLLLGESDGVVNVGEASHFWDRGVLDNHYCGCGERFSDCPFWTDVMTTAGFKSDAGAAQSIHERQRRAISHHSLWRLGTAKSDEDVIASTRAFYSAISEMSGANWIVDSSKQPIYARFLIDVLGRDRVHVLNLVRDPRGVAYSAAKRRRKTDTGDDENYMVSRTFVQSALNWNKVQLSTELLGLSDIPIHRLRYEDLCEHGEKPLQAILQQIDGDLGERYRYRLASRSQGAQWGREQHTVSGNPMRVASGMLAIKPDVEWRERLPGGALLTISAITLLFLLRYEYSILWK